MAGGPKASNGGGAAKPKRVVLTKNQKKRLKKKEKRAAAASEPAPAPPPPPPQKKENVVVEYVSAAYDADAAASLFKDVFAKFATAEELTTDQVEEVAAETPAEQKADDVDEDEAPEKRLSRKQRKAMSRMTVAELKQVVARPEAVEAHDVTASDPRLLVFLKSYRNTVPVPRHWCHKRKFLQGKRGVEKKPFQLPEYIAQTGILPSVFE
jgi:splicing factor 3B subunit 2